MAEPVEKLVAAMVLHRLDSAELADNLAGRSSSDERQLALTNDLAADRSQADELAKVYSTKGITMQEWMVARDPINKRIQGAERQLEQYAGSSALAGLVGNGQELDQGWEGQNLERQAMIVGALLEYATIGAGVSGARQMDPSRVHPVWRL